jgi:hypothetical protein
MLMLLLLLMLLLPLCTHVRVQVPELSTSIQMDLNEPFTIMKPGSTKHKALIIGQCVILIYFCMCRRLLVCQ